jgi:hypothetical protein
MARLAFWDGVNKLWSHLVTLAVSVGGGSAGGIPQLDANGKLDGSFLGALSEFTTTSPAVPTAGVTEFSRRRAGRAMPSNIGAPLNVADSALEYTFQPSMFQKAVGMLTPTGNGTGLAAQGLNASVTGTTTARNVATTNLMTAIRRLGYVSAATAAASAGVRHGALQFYLGNATGRGGFFYVSRFGVSHAAAVADARGFVGLLNSAAVIGNVNPSTLLNMIGVAWDNAQTTLRIMSNDATGVATSVDLGANFPSNTLSADMYELRLFATPNSSRVYWSVERLGTSFIAEGVITADLPAANTLLSPQVWINNGATALAVGIDIGVQYIETEF